MNHTFGWSIIWKAYQNLYCHRGIHPVEYAAHINSCYDGICIAEAALQSYNTRLVYDATLWLAVKNNQAGKIVATGITELDCEIGEGILELIQVSKDYRGNGFGRYIAFKLLFQTTLASEI